MGKSHYYTGHNALRNTEYQFIKLIYRPYKIISIKVRLATLKQFTELGFGNANEFLDASELDFDQHDPFAWKEGLKTKQT